MCLTPGDIRRIQLVFWVFILDVFCKLTFLFEYMSALIQSLNSYVRVYAVMKYKILYFVFMSCSRSYTIIKRFCPCSCQEVLHNHKISTSVRVHVSRSYTSTKRSRLVLVRWCNTTTKHFISCSCQEVLYNQKTPLNTSVHFRRCYKPQNTSFRVHIRKSY